MSFVIKSTVENTRMIITMFNALKGKKHLYGYFQLQIEYKIIKLTGIYNWFDLERWFDVNKKYNVNLTKINTLR